VIWDENDYENSAQVENTLEIEDQQEVEDEIWK